LETAADGTDSIVAYLLNPDGSVNGNQTLTSSSDTTSITAPNIACNDDGICLVTWGSYDSSDQTAQVMAARLHKSLSSPSMVTVATQDGGREVSSPAVASDGTDFMVAWGKGASGNVLELWVRPVTSAGQITEPVQQIPDAISDQWSATPHVSLVWGGTAFSSYVAAWGEGDGLWYATVSASGDANERIEIGGGAGIPPVNVWYAPKLAYDPLSQQVLVVYTSGGFSASNIQLMARRLNTSGVSSEITLDTSDAVHHNDLTANVIADAKNGGWIISWANPWQEPLTTYSPTVAGTYYQAIGPDGSLRQSEQSLTQIVQGTSFAPGVALACTQPLPRLELNFEESAGATSFADDSGASNDASCASDDSCPLAGEGGRFGNGVVFDGTDDYLDTDTSVVELGKGDFTIGAWVKTDVAGSTQQVAIVTKSDGDTSWEVGEKSFYLNDSGQPTFVGWGNDYIHSVTTVNDGFWHHVVVVWDYADSGGSGIGGVARMYVDGVNATANSTNYRANNSDNTGDTLKIARPNYGEAPNYFSGTMDGIVVYDRALSAAEVGDVFDAAITIFDLDEVDGSTTFVDSSNNGFDATCSGSLCPTMGVAGVAYTAAQFDGTDDFLEIQTSKRTVEIFSYDFESDAGSGWNNSTRTSAAREGSSTTFLDTFGNETVTLNLNDLPTHDTIEVSFDLFLPGSWDGDRTDDGPDNWLWGADDSQIFKSNFSNQSDSTGNYQYYPANWCSSCDNGWWTNELYGLTVYKDSDCTGVSQTFTADAPDLGAEPIGNDTISCLEYYKHHDVSVAVLYKNANYGGTAWDFDIKRGVVPSYESDAISSIRVWPAAHAPKHGTEGDSLSVSGFSEGTIYRFSDTISNHTSDTLSLYFKGDTSSSDPEYWGLDNVVVSVKSDHGSVPLTNSSFTLSAWAKRNTTDADWILGQGSSGDNTALHFGFRDSGGFYCGFSSDFSNSLNASLGNHTDWRHYACTYDADTNTRTLYENGVEVASDTASDDYAGVGATTIGSLPFGDSYFSGDIDEVAMWTAALSADDILELYEKVKVEDESVLSCLLARTADADTFSVHNLTLRETTTDLGVDTQTIARTIGIDADSPTTTILAPSAGYVGGDGTLNVSGDASDPTSYVAEVEVQTNGGDWQTAEGAESWSYNWDTNVLNEGLLTLSARATDVVGHVGGSASLSLILDLTSPSVSLVSPSDQVRPTRNVRGRWLVSMSGDVAEPGAGNQFGRGVASVEVLLQGSQELAGNGWQKASVHSDRTAWSLDYLLPAYGDAGQSMVDPSGAYTATLRATDAVNNTTAAADYVKAVMTVEATAPEISLTSPDAATDLISTTLTLSGLVTETNQIASVEINFTPAEQIGALYGTVLHLPFDENQNTEYWADQSGSNHPAVCTSRLNCPGVNETGQRDKAVYYSGTSELAVDGIVLANKSFTLAAWAKRWLTGDWSILMSQGTETTDQGLIFGFRPGDIFTCAFWNDDLDTTSAYSDREWHHWVCTYDVDTNTRTIYLDGAQVAQDTAAGDFQGSGVFYVGRRFVGYKYNGQLDEVTVHDRALADYEVANLYAYGFGTWETASLNGDVNPTWSYTIPEGDDGMEGIYQINVRGTDALGNTTPLGSQRLWRGEIDTRPPELSFSASSSTVAGITSTQYECVATDFNLDEDGSCQAVSSDVPEFRSTDMTLTTYDTVDQWYAAQIADATRLYSMDAVRSYQADEQSGVQVQACDKYNRCTTTGASALQSASAEASADPTLAAEVMIPSSGDVLTSTAPITVTGYAYALDALQALTVTLDGALVYTETWAVGAMTNTLWSFAWTPPDQGVYLFEPAVSDWNGNTATGERPATIYVDTEPPSVDIAPTVLTPSEQIGDNMVQLAGTTTDVVQMQRVEVSVDGGPWQRASVSNGQWQLPWRLSGPADGASFTVTARATDVAGRTATATETVLVDIVTPQPVEINLAYVNTGDERLAIAPGATLTDAESLEVGWAAGTDGIARYEVGFSLSPTPDPADLTSYTEPTTHSQTVGEAEVWYAHLQLVDGVGNTHTQTVGPVYVDAPFTPDLVTDLGYRDWANDVCTIEGVDRRVAQASPGTSGDEIQRFYVSWDEDDLRLSWHGADWTHDGDLFVYLDTRPGGAVQLFNPYPADSDTTIYLPGNMPEPSSTASTRQQSAQLSVAAVNARAAMQADLVVWVEGAGEATLWRWDGSGRWDSSGWQNEGSLDDDAFRLTVGVGDSFTDIRLPFEMLGILDPASASLGLLAVAAEEEEALRLWSTMPTRNPLNSERVVNSIAAQSEEHTFALARAYFWNTLGSGQCPNGRLGDDAGPTGGPFADSDLQLTLSADPVGTTYNFMNDDLAWLWTALFGFESVPVVPSTLFDFHDTDHPPLGPTQTVTFTIDYVNQGTETATGVQVALESWFSLALPDGDATPNGLGQRQVVGLGDVPAGASGSYVVVGTVDVADLGQEHYDLCLETFPPVLCEAELEWIALDAFVYDDQTPLDPAHGPWSSAPLEWMWSDHEVDSAPPYAVGIEAPSNVIGAGPTTVRGHAHDESDVPLINLEVRDGDIQSIQCPDSSPHDGRWQCTWDPEDTEHGDTFDLRAQAVDEFGQASDWSAWLTIIVDTDPPTVTVEPGVDGQTFGVGIHTLRGTISDNHDIAAVQVCVAEGECSTVDVQATKLTEGQHTEGVWSYNLPSPDTPNSDGLLQTLDVYGSDSAGNRSSDPVTVTYWLDFAPPVLSVTSVVEHIVRASPGPVMAGTVSDGSAFDVYVRVEPPSGVRYRAKAAVSDDAWAFTPSWIVPGDYRVWAQAVDIAGNTTTSGPYQIEVGSVRVYLPLVQRQAVFTSSNSSPMHQAP